MIIFTTNNSNSVAPMQVTIANGDTLDFPEIHEAYVEGGALILYGRHRSLVVAFGPGAWLEVQRA